MLLKLQTLLMLLVQLQMTVQLRVSRCCLPLRVLIPPQRVPTLPLRVPILPIRVPMVLKLQLLSVILSQWSQYGTLPTLHLLWSLLCALLRSLFKSRLRFTRLPSNTDHRIQRVLDIAWSKTTSPSISFFHVATALIPRKIHQLQSILAIRELVTREACLQKMKRL